MSRRTIVALLVAIALTVGTKAWTLGHTDSCDAARAGDPHAPSTQIVEAGTQTIEVPCSDWIHRQSMFVQAWCMADVAAAFVFGIYAWRDWKGRGFAGA